MRRKRAFESYNHATIYINKAKKYEDEKWYLHAATPLSYPGYVGYTYVEGESLTFLELERRKGECIKDAKRCLEEATRYYPEYHQAYYELGRLYYQYSRYDMAETHFRLAIQYCPKDNYNLKNLSLYLQYQGLVHYKLKNFVDSVKLYTQAITIAPSATNERKRRKSLRKLGSEQRIVAICEDELELDRTLEKNDLKAIIEDYHKQKGRYRKIASFINRGIITSLGIDLRAGKTKTIGQLEALLNEQIITAGKVLRVLTEAEVRGGVFRQQSGSRITLFIKKKKASLDSEQGNNEEEETCLSQTEKAIQKIRSKLEEGRTDITTTLFRPPPLDNSKKDKTTDEIELVDKQGPTPLSQ